MNMQLAQEKESNFSQFKKIFSFFTKNEKNKESRANYADYDRISKQISELINNNMLPLVFDYLGSGYKLDEIQTKNLYKQLDEMHYSNRVDFFSTCIKKDIKLSDDLLINYFSDFGYAKTRYDIFLKDYQQTNDKKTGKVPLRQVQDNTIESFFIDMNEISKDVKDQYSPSAFVEYTLERLPYLNLDLLYDKWVENLNKYYDIIKSPLKLEFKVGETKFFKSAMDDMITPIQNYGDYILKDKSMSEILSFVTKIDHMYKNVNDNQRCRHVSIRDGLHNISYLLKEIPEKYFQSQIENDKKQISILYSDDQFNQLIIEENIKFNQNNDIKSLPQKAKDILDNIKNDYLKLNKLLGDLDEEEKFTVDNLWNKRIPEIINKYLRADPEFRSNMKNTNGQSIEDLMIDSLNNIHDKLNEINMNHSQNVLHDMSAINRYTKNIKM